METITLNDFCVYHKTDFAWDEFEVTATWTPPQTYTTSDRDNPLYHDMGEDGIIHNLDVYSKERGMWLSERECEEFLIDNYDRIYDQLVDF